MLAARTVINFAVPATATSPAAGRKLAANINALVPSRAPRLNLDFGATTSVTPAFCEGLLDVLADRGPGVNVHLWSLGNLTRSARKNVLDTLGARAIVVEHLDVQLHTLVITVEPDQSTYEQGFALGAANTVIGPIGLDLHIDTTEVMTQEFYQGLLDGLENSAVSTVIWGPAPAATTNATIINGLTETELARRKYLRGLMASYGPIRVASTCTPPQRRILMAMTHSPTPTSSAQSAALVNTVTSALGKTLPDNLI